MTDEEAISEMDTFPPLESALIFALHSLVDSGIPPDVQELLMHGDGRGTVAPGALRKALEAAIKNYKAPSSKG